MWLFDILPPVLVHCAFFGAVGGLVVGTALHYRSLQLVGLVVMCITSYIEGGIAESESWNAKVKQLEMKVTQAEEKSAKTSVEVITKVITKKQVIREKSADVIKFIEKEIVKYDDTCMLPPAVIKAHNDAASVLPTQ